MCIEESFKILDVPFNASFEEIRQAYKRKVKAYHPDQFCHSPDHQKYASETLKKINIAYAVIVKYLEIRQAEDNLKQLNPQPTKQEEKFSFKVWLQHLFSVEKDGNRKKTPAQTNFNLNNSVSQNHQGRSKQRKTQSFSEIMHELDILGGPKSSPLKKYTKPDQIRKAGLKPKNLIYRQGNRTRKNNGKVSPISAIRPIDRIKPINTD